MASSTSTRLRTHSHRFDIGLAASCMAKNAKVAAEVLADERAGDALHHNARRLMEVTELNLADAVSKYLRQL